MNGKNSEGYTLIEILISITILSIILISFVGFLSQGFIFSSKNEDSLVASNLSTHVLEKIQNNYNAANCVDSPNIFPNYSYLFEEATNEGITLNNQTYYVTVILDCNTDNADLDLPILHVTIFDSPSKQEDDLITETFGFVSN